jgi:hypothetical protein
MGEPFEVNVTVPVGVLEPVVGETVDVKVTETPTGEGFSEETSTDVVLMSFTY